MREITIFTSKLRKEKFSFRLFANIDNDKDQAKPPKLISLAGVPYAFFWCFNSWLRSSFESVH